MSDNLLPPSGPGRPKDLTKRAAILDAAKNLFLRLGYDGCSMDAIAAEAGVSKLTVYSHFTDKETLFSMAVRAKCEEQMPLVIFELLETAPIETVLLNVAQAFHCLVSSRESIELHRVMISLGSQDPKLAKMFYDSGPKVVHDEMAGLLKKADQLGKLRIENPELAAEHFLCLLKGGINFRLLIGCNAEDELCSTEEQIADAVAMFVRAYLPR
jgi:TetR/AcrR family transcriptional repressor of mexJK operon